MQGDSSLILGCKGDGMAPSCLGNEALVLGPQDQTQLKQQKHRMSQISNPCHFLRIPMLA